MTAEGGQQALEILGRQPVLARLGYELDGGFERVPVRNSRGEQVGELAAES